jgi:hypothetical protein
VVPLHITTQPTLDALALLQDMIYELDYFELTVLYLTDSLAQRLFSLLLPQPTFTTFGLFVASHRFEMHSIKHNIAASMGRGRDHNKGQV